MNSPDPRKHLQIKEAYSRIVYTYTIPAGKANFSPLLADPEVTAAIFCGPALRFHGEG